MELQPTTQTAINLADELAEAADRKLRELLKESTAGPLADFIAPDAVDLQQEIVMADFEREYPILSKVVKPALWLLMALSMGRGGGGRMVKIPVPAW